MQCVPLAGGSFRALPPEVIGALFGDYVEFGSEDKQPIDTYPSGSQLLTPVRFGTLPKGIPLNASGMICGTLQSGFRRPGPRKRGCMKVSTIGSSRLQPMAP